LSKIEISQVVPCWEASDGNIAIVTSSIAGILSGSIAGDHCTPLSDIVVLTSISTECQLIAHVITQVPYVLLVIFCSIFVGTLPVGFEIYPNTVAHLMGIGFITISIFSLCVPVVNETGKFDMLTELVMRYRPASQLHKIKHDTAIAFRTANKIVNSKNASEDSVIDSGVKTRSVASEEESVVDGLYFLMAESPCSTIISFREAEEKSDMNNFACEQIKSS